MSNKLFKSELKSIVKECLIEILSEGLLPKKQSNITSSRINTKNVTMSENKKLLMKQKTKNKAVKMDTNLTNNDILNEMLLDTAATTLQEQRSAERNKSPMVVGNDPVARAVAESTPEEIFGEQSSKWASLAFSN